MVFQDCKRLHASNESIFLSTNIFADQGRNSVQFPPSPACMGRPGRMNSPLVTHIVTHKFEEEFGISPKIFAAPGRVNLIGEHTDYNDGFVLPCAIGFTTRVAIAPRLDRKLVVLSEGFPERFEFDLEDLPATRRGAWVDYVLGVAVMLRQMEALYSGASVMVQGGVPIGAGLSSSAAVEVASALALMSLNGAIFPMLQVAKICQRAENTFVGARVGIMDQLVACMGKQGDALRLARP